MIEKKTKIELLELKQKALLESISKEDFANWQSFAPTRALFIQFEIDQEELRENWSLGVYTENEQLRAQGQSFYILDLENKIREMKDA